MTTPCLQLVLHACMNTKLHPTDARKCCIDSAPVQLHMEHYVGKLLGVR